MGRPPRRRGAPPLFSDGLVVALLVRDALAQLPHVVAAGEEARGLGLEARRRRAGAAAAVLEPQEVQQRAVRLVAEHVVRAVAAHDLAEREKAGYSLARVRVVMADGSERAAVAFAALPGGGSSGDAVNPYLVPEGEGRSVAATARVIARSAGKSGKNIDYFRMLLEIMRARRVHDEHLEAIDVELARVAAAAVAVDGAGADGAAGAAQPQAST